MSTRMKLVGAASAALISATMMIAPTGAAASPAPSPDQGRRPRPTPTAHSPPVAPAPPNPAIAPAESNSGRPREPQLYEPEADSGFHPIDSIGASDDVTEKLGDADIRLLQQAQADETSTVTVMMLARKGAADDVVAAVRKAGGTVGSVTEKLGYVRATVPTDSVSELAGMSTVKAIDLNRTYRVPAPELGTGEAPTRSARDAGPSAPGREHARREPLHADRRDRCRLLREGESEMGRSRHRRRRARHGRRRRAPGAAEDHRRQAQDHRLGDRDRSDPGRGRRRGSRCRPSAADLRSAMRATTGPRPPATS